jgi:hypothetical protein
MRGIQGPGSVIEVLPKIHNTVRYEYSVDGRAFHGAMQSWRPNPPIEQLSVGQPLVVYHDPQHPEDSVLGDPKPMLENETGSIALAALIIPAIIVLRVRWWIRRRTSPSVATSVSG